jgi:hypothetical protein
VDTTAPEAPPLTAGGILMLVEKHGDPDRRARVASERIPGSAYPLIRIGQMMFTQDEITAAADAGWLELTHDADAGWLWLAPGARGAAWLDRPGRTRRP